MLSNKLNYKLINFAVLMFLLYISFSNVNIIIEFIATIFSVLLPFIVAFSFAYSLYPIQSYLTDKKISKFFSILIIVVFIIILIFIMFRLTLPLIYEQLLILSNNIVNLSKTFSEKYNISFSTIKLTNNINLLVNALGKLLSSGVIVFLNKSVSIIGKSLICIISFVYFLIEMDSIRNNIKKVTKFISNNLYSYIKYLDSEIRNYIKGLLMVILIQSIEYSALFFLVGHPNWLLLGTLAGITTIIPYIGGLITNILAILTAYATSSDLLISTIIICIIFPQLDGYIITPRVYGKTNNINSLTSIIVIFVGTKFGGILGTIISIPIYLLIRSTYEFYKKDIKKNIQKIKTISQ